MVKVVKGVSAIVTRYVPPAPNSKTCKGAMVIKTIINPISDLRTFATYALKDGKMIHTDGKPGTFSVFSPITLNSTPTELFGDWVQVVGRALMSSTRCSVMEGFATESDVSLKILNVVEPTWILPCTDSKQRCFLFRNLYCLKIV